MTNDKYEDSEITEDCFLELEDLCWDLDDYFPLFTWEDELND